MYRLGSLFAYPAASVKTVGNTLVIGYRTIAQQDLSEIHVSLGLCRNTRDTVGAYRSKSILENPVPLIGAKGGQR